MYVCMYYDIGTHVVIAFFFSVRNGGWFWLLMFGNGADDFGNNDDFRFYFYPVVSYCTLL